MPIQGWTPTTLDELNAAGYDAPYIRRERRPPGGLSSGPTQGPPGLSLHAEEWWLAVDYRVRQSSPDSAEIRHSATRDSAESWLRHWGSWDLPHAHRCQCSRCEG